MSYVLFSILSSWTKNCSMASTPLLQMSIGGLFSFGLPNKLGNMIWVERLGTILKDKLYCDVLSLQIMYESSVNIKLKF